MSNFACCSAVTSQNEHLTIKRMLVSKPTIADYRQKTSVSSSPTPVSDNCVLPTLEHSYAQQFRRQDLCHRRTTSLEQSAAQSQTMWAVIRPVQAFFFLFFLIRGGTRSLRMPALRSASQAGPMRNAREGTSVVLRDTIRLT